MKAITVVYEFGSFRLDPAKRLLTQNGTNLSIRPKTFELLLFLIEQRQRVVSKEELFAALWPNTFVEYSSLAFQISALRKVFGTEGSEWIENLPRYGYRFSAKVIESEEDSAQAQPVEAVLPPVDDPPAAPLSHRPKLFWFLGALTLVSVLVSVYMVLHLIDNAPKDRGISFEITLPSQLTTPDVGPIVVSPNGDRVLFTGVGADGTRQIWIRDLDSLNPHPVSGTELVDGAFWSQDGRSFGFFAAGKLKTVNLQDGSQHIICDTRPQRASGTWNDAGVILFETAGDPVIYRISDRGGTAVPATRLNDSARETHHFSPQFLPDGRHFIYFARSEQPENSGIYVSELGSNQSKLLTHSEANGVYTARNGSPYLLYVRESNLMAQRLDMGELSLLGDPFLVSRRLLLGPERGGPRAALSASQNGILTYRTRVDSDLTELTWFDRAGKRIGTIGQPGEYTNPALSPDEKKLLVTRMDERLKTRDIWSYDIGKDAFSRLSFDPGDEGNPIWSPDGNRVAYDGFSSGISSIWQQDFKGVSSPKSLLQSRESLRAYDWSADGTILYQLGPSIWAAHSPKGVIGGPYAISRPRISPNGKWVAYASNQSGRSEVYLQRFPPSQGLWQVSTTGGMEPIWQQDGKELYFVRGDDLYAIDVKTDAENVELGIAKLLFSVRLERTDRRSRYQVADNGRRFLVNEPQEFASNIIVSSSWVAAPAY